MLFAPANNLRDKMEGAVSFCYRYVVPNGTKWRVRYFVTDIKSLTGL